MKVFFWIILTLAIMSWTFDNYSTLIGTHSLGIEKEANDWIRMAVMNLNYKFVFIHIIYNFLSFFPFFFGSMKLIEIGRNIDFSILDSKKRYFYSPIGWTSQINYFFYIFLWQTLTIMFMFNMLSFVIFHFLGGFSWVIALK